MSEMREKRHIRDASDMREFGDKSDKPMAGSVTALFVVPAVLLCCLGPVVVFALLSGAFGGAIGWLAGLDVGAVVLAVAVGAVTVAWLMRRRGMRRQASRSAVKEQSVKERT